MNNLLTSQLIYYGATRLAGEPVFPYVRQYRSRDRMTYDELLRYQSEQLLSIIQYANSNTKYYRERPIESDGPKSIYPQLNGIPLLEKSDLRKFSRDLLADTNFLFPQNKTTSGSTGQPLTVVKNRDALARERAATWRAYGWAGIQVAAPQAFLWGVPHSKSGKYKARLLDLIANRKRLSVFGATEVEFAKFHQAITKFNPQYMYGYVSALTSFINYMSSRGLLLPKSLRAIVTTAEVLDSDSRHILESFSGLRVFNEYGCGEVGSIAHECENGHLHIMADNLVVEALPDPTLPDGLGELVVTDLYNHAMPLIRYRLGDLGRLSDSACDCGRPYPILERIVGRAYDIVYDVQGRAYHPEAILYIFEDLRRGGLFIPPYQALQEEHGQLKIRLHTETVAEELSRSILARFRTVFQDGFRVELVAVGNLEREPSGKLRVVKQMSQN